MFLNEADNERLEQVKAKLGFPSKTATVSRLLGLYKSESERELPPATYESVFSDDKPVIVSGEPRSGKTTTVKAILTQYAGNVFVVDVTGKTLNEYPEFRKVSWERATSMTWRGKAVRRIRWIPNPDLKASIDQASRVFDRMNQVKSSGALLNWVVTVEEAHRFAGDASFRALIDEAGKFVKKLILVTPEKQLFAGMAKVLAPALHEGITKVFLS